MLNRRGFLRTVGVSLLAAPLAAEAQRTGKTYRVGYLTTNPRPPASVPQLSEMLRELGYIEGQNLHTLERRSDGKNEPLPGLAAELVKLKVDVIVAPLPEDIVAAKQATATIPIVMIFAVDAVGAGFVTSLARPGGNVTGMEWTNPERAGKDLEVLKEIAPKISRVAVIQDPTSAANQDFARLAEGPARRLGITVQSVELRQPSDLDQALVKIRQGRADALWAWTTGPVASVRGQIIDFAILHRLPSLWGGGPAAIRLGGLMSYQASLVDQLRRTASYVDKILKGAKPADLPVERPTKFDLLINLKTANAIGLIIPPSMLLRADQIFE